MKLNKLEKKLLSQVKEMRRELAETLTWCHKAGIAYFLCLSCGMPVYRGVAVCNLCPTEAEKIKVEGK